MYLSSSIIFGCFLAELALCICLTKRCLVAALPPEVFSILLEDEPVYCICPHHLDWLVVDRPCCHGVKEGILLFDSDLQFELAVADKEGSLLVVEEAKAKLVVYIGQALDDTQTQVVEVGSNIG